jgi:hypothetical protein
MKRMFLSAKMMEGKNNQLIGFTPLLCPTKLEARRVAMHATL